MAMSLDGYVAGPNDAPGNPLGDGGGRVHEWMYRTSAWQESHGREGGERNRDAELVEDWIARSGAHVMGRRMFDHGEDPWGPEPPFRKPVFVVTRREREPLTKGETTFTFVTDGIERALELARAEAGDKDVEVSGGAQMVQQYLRAGLLDELQIHYAPVFLGGGVRLFDGPGLEPVALEPEQVVESPRVTHVRYRVVR
jgi:dihydrofolate reductase